MASVYSLANPLASGVPRGEQWLHIGCRIGPGRPRRPADTGSTWRLGSWTFGPLPDSDSPLPLAAAASNAPVLQWHCGSADGASGRGKSCSSHRGTDRRRATGSHCTVTDRQWARRCQRGCLGLAQLRCQWQFEGRMTVRRNTVTRKSRFTGTISVTAFTQFDGVRREVKLKGSLFKFKIGVNLN